MVGGWWGFMECWPIACIMCEEPLGEFGVCPQENFKRVLLRLKLKALLTENYETVKLMVGGYPLHSPPGSLLHTLHMSIIVS